jgi:hypothetical protein
MNQPLLASPDRPVNCGYDGNPSDCITTNTALNARYRVPFMGETPSALMASRFTGRSSYHGFQSTLRKQLSHGISFQAAYTFSKAMSDGAIYNDLTDPARNWGRSSFDRTHRLIANFDARLPDIAARRGLASRLMNGWSATGIIIMQTGLPLTLTDPAGGGVYGRASTSTVTLCQGATIASLATTGSVQERLSRWINPSVLCSPAAIGADGSTGYGNTGVGIMNGPPQVNTDFSLGKRTVIGGLREDGELAFRVEFYNALNHAQFANPGSTLGTANFGVVTQTSVAPRLIQFGLKYLF